VVCLFGGHRWTTSGDAAGSVTTCSRCGALRHVRKGSIWEGDMHSGDRGPLPSHGPEELDAEQP